MTRALVPDAAPDAPEIPAVHLAIRFALELAAIAGLGIWGWHLGDGGVSGVLLGALFATAGMSAWAIFRVPGDPGGGRPVIVVPGWLRLALELAVFGLAAAGVWTSWSRAAAETLLTVVALHYAVTWERSRWLLTRRPSGATES
jgi:hypothetical protein